MRHRQHGHVAHLGREAPEAAERDERGNGQAGALHVLGNRGGQGVGATERQAGEFQVEIDSRPTRKTTSMRGLRRWSTPSQCGDGKEGPCGCLVQCAYGAGTGPASLSEPGTCTCEGQALRHRPADYKVLVSNDLRSSCAGVVFSAEDIGRLSCAASGSNSVHAASPRRHTIADCRNRRR